MASYELLAVEGDAKTVKGKKLGILTGVLYMAPAMSSGFQMCAAASPGCVELCLGLHAGRVEFTPSIVASRIRKAREYIQDRAAFLAKLERDIARLIKAAAARDLRPAVRLNGSTDIIWERVRFADGSTLMDRFPDVQFYDYTKHEPTKRAQLPANYKLTFSLSEKVKSEEQAAAALALGWNVAIVFRAKPGTPLPEVTDINSVTHLVVDGDETDVRFLDSGFVYGLHAKGRKAQNDRSGFVRER